MGRYFYFRFAPKSDISLSPDKHDAVDMTGSCMFSCHSSLSNVFHPYSPEAGQS